MELEEKFEDLKEELHLAFEEYPRLKDMLSFISVMLAAGLIFRLVIFLDPDTYFLQEQLAGVSSQFLNYFGYTFETQGALIIGETNNYLITRDCLGWKSMAAFTALIAASADKIRNEARIILIGLTAIVLANLVRIVSTVMLSEMGVISFDIIHTFLWRWGMTLIVLLLWYLWLDNGQTFGFLGIFK